MKKDYLRKIERWAREGHRETGIPESVIMAQWILETGWGTSRLWQECHNFAGIKFYGSYKNSHGFTCYPDLEKGFWGWVRTIKLPYYSEVRKLAKLGKKSSVVARELGKSPWAENHYDAGSGPGSTLTALIEQHSLYLYDSGPASFKSNLEKDLESLSLREIVLLFFKVILKKL